MPRMIESRLPKEDRVRNATSRGENQRLDKQAAQNIRAQSDRSAEDVSARIDELRREWDIERYLELNASTLALTGVILGVFFGKKWLLLPAAVLGFLLQHALQGWCPPVPLFRHNNIRTRQEIDRELYALKALRGDFNGIRSGKPAKQSLAKNILAAVDR
jgi:hypothetical protein